MPEYDPAYFGSHWAQIYDDVYPALPDERDCIECLTALAGRGPVLELGIGTGRVALPLARRNVEVHGIEGALEMVTKLREKPGGKDLLVRVGNLVDIAVEDEYTLIFAIFNTLSYVTNQNDQARCFVNVARHLSSTGSLSSKTGFPFRARGV